MYWTERQSHTDVKLKLHFLVFNTITILSPPPLFASPTHTHLPPTSHHLSQLYSIKCGVLFKSIIVGNCQLWAEFFVTLKSKLEIAWGLKLGEKNFSKLLSQYAPFYRNVCCQNKTENEF